MPFLPLFTGIRHLAHVLTVPPTKACRLCATPAGLDLDAHAMPVGTYRVQSLGFPKIVYCEGQSHKAVSTNHSLFSRERRAEADSNQGPSAYQPNALPLGQPAHSTVRIQGGSYNYWTPNDKSAVSEQPERLRETVRSWTHHDQSTASTQPPKYNR